MGYIGIVQSKFEIRYSKESVFVGRLSNLAIELVKFPLDMLNHSVGLDCKEVNSDFLVDK